MSQRSIEVKVGALILVALGLLGAFVVVMGGLSFEPTFTVYVAFHNPGGLQAGAPVRISGVKVGRVASMEFRGGLVDPRTHEREPLIRAVAKLEKRYQEAVRQDSRWFVTSQGVLGEMFLAVEPGTLEKPMLADGAVVQGISPPRLDLLLSESYELLHRAYLGITNNEQKLQETFDGLHRTLKASGDFLEQNQEKLSRTVDNVEGLSKDAKETLAALHAEGLRIVMLTGDSEATARAVADELGLDEVHAGQSPENKAGWISNAHARGARVAMAGDGVNDAPALATADVGIAMGNGTDIAMESAQITLVKGELAGILRARRLSRATVRNIHQNLAFAFVYNSLGVPIAAGLLYPFFGWLLSPVIAAAAMSLSSVSVISNALPACSNAARAAAAFPSPSGPANRSRIAATTDASVITPVSAANAPRRGTLGSGRPRCSRASSVAGTVSARSGRRPRTSSASPSSSKPRAVLTRT